MNFLLIFALLTGTGATALGYAPLGPGDFQSFVKNWQPETRPLCAAIQNERQWEAVMHPAPVMGPHKPFAPEASFWKGHAVLVLARVTNGGDAARVLRMGTVQRVGDFLNVYTAFKSNPTASWTMKLWTGAAVAKPLPRTIRFIENGRIVCELHPSAGAWLLPKRQ